MVCNVGKTDRTMRFIGGFVVIALGIYFGSWLGALGLIPLFTATTRWCPAYLPFGFSSDKK
jgi:Protein of unknown function (DUF2892)